MAIVKEPEGIGFYNIKTGDKHYCKLEPTIAAYINSSDMGINASRGQDYGWRLAPEWVNMVEEFSADEDKMDQLGAKLRLEDDVSPSTLQILNYIYGRQVRKYLQRLKAGDTPFEQKYRDDIAKGRTSAAADPEDFEDEVTEPVKEPKPAKEPKPTPEK